MEIILTIGTLSLLLDPWLVAESRKRKKPQSQIATIFLGLLICLQIGMVAVIATYAIRSVMK